MILSQKHLNMLDKIAIKSILFKVVTQNSFKVFKMKIVKRNFLYSVARINK